MKPNHSNAIIFFVFLMSGFCGLIYQSVWSHYLKLVLGHAAYGQTVVIVVFMGGLALGSAAAGYAMKFCKHPLIWFAACELALGLFAVFFHNIFVSFSEQLYTFLNQSNDNALGGTLKWFGSIAIILPQSILMGATFPLISAALIRKKPENLGRTLGLLYFLNSFGAAIGVLVSAFLLIPSLGLPGAILTAGLLETLLAFAIWVTHKREQNHTSATIPASFFKTIGSRPSERQPHQLIIALFAVTFISSMASFFYEIAWIRLLSLVFGSSVYSFEVMLSAFIFGLAFGGLLMRKRINHLTDPLAALGKIQIIMGITAVLTIPLYNYLPGFMSIILNTLERDEMGYGIYHVTNLVLSLSIMLPSSVAAGMTLPLITSILLKKCGRESMVGQTYAWNTLGAIIGVLLAVHLIMPILGTRNLLLMGGIIDSSLGALIIFAATKNPKFTSNKSNPAWAMTTALFFLTSALIFQLDPHKMLSGVYRTGEAQLAENVNIEFLEDGKTASISLVSTNGFKQISTNGKPDAAINTAHGEPAVDEVTMVMLGALPLALSPKIHHVANIGFGSGLTTHTLLASPHIQTVDTIEIEHKVIEASKGFGETVARAYDDSRSQIHIEDARTFFASQDKQYDLIVSEPSNPWVSGVANLFTTEFYGHLKTNLSENGILVQWTHLYEINTQLIASIFKALEPNFDKFALYNIDDGNLIFVATSGDIDLTAISPEPFSYPDLRPLLSRVGIEEPHDIAIRYLGDQETFAPFFNSFPIAANADYFPILSYRAPKSFFIGQDSSLAGLTTTSIPINNTWNQPTWSKIADFTPSSRNRSFYARRLGEARSYYDHIIQGNSSTIDSSDMATIHSQVEHRLSNCELGTPLEAFSHEAELRFLLGRLYSYLTPDQLMKIWQVNGWGRCREEMSPWLTHWLDLHKATIDRQWLEVFHHANALLTTNWQDPYERLPLQSVEYLLITGLNAAGLLSDSDRGLRFWQAHGYRAPAGEPSIPLRFSLAQLFYKD